MSSQQQNAFYAVKNGIQPGVYNTWEECRAQIDGFTGAKFKKFNNKEEAEAFITTLSVEQGTSTPTGPNLDALSLEQQYAFYSTARGPICSSRVPVEPANRI